MDHKVTAQLGDETSTPSPQPEEPFPDLLRDFTIKLDDNARHTVTELPVTVGAVLAAGQPIVLIRTIREQRNSDGDMIKVESEKTYEFDTDAYVSPVLHSLYVAVGQELPPGTSTVGSYLVEHTFRNLIEKRVIAAAKTRSDLHFRSIPPRKLDNAISTYAKSVDPDRALFLYDDTVFGSAKEGFLITDSAFYYHIGAQDLQLRFNEVTGTHLKTRKVRTDDGLIKRTTVQVILGDGNDGLQISESYGGVNLTEFADLLETILKYCRQGLTKDMDGYVIVEDMADAVKGDYSQFQYRNEPERRAMYRAWGRVGNWLRWWAMMPLALSDSKSSEGRATADEGLGGGLAVRRVDWATQRFPQPSHGRGPPKHESGCGKAVENAGSVVSRRVGRSGVMPRSAMRRRRFGTACRARG